MAYNISTGSINKGIRKEFVDSVVKQIAMRTYKMKQAVAIVPTNAWTNTFFREDPNGKTAVVGNNTEGIPRVANFPQTSLNWEED